MNKRELMEMYLSEDLAKAEDNYKRWLESYKFFLTSDKVSKELITYYKRETEVAHDIWQLKLKCYSKKISNPISE